MLRFPTKKRTRPTIHLTALIDIVFLLLIFFLLASSFVEQAGVAIIVPEIESEGSGLLPEIIVQIDQSGNILIDETNVNQRQLTTILKLRIKSLAKDTVVIQADRRVQYDTVVEVIDAAKLAGAKNLILLTKRKP
ncbi:MAG: biopolymer transporter ExbD [Gammaproteobacteria bacterium]|jgi:biopolymer transport protein ExbD